ncbi:MAG: hypothetical protein WC809_15250 [Sinimarinibacterium sp.]|jgi:hypothetical protein
MIHTIIRMPIRRALVLSGVISLSATALILSLKPPAPPQDVADVCPAGTEARAIRELARELRPELDAAQVEQLVVQLGEFRCLPGQLPKSFAAKELAFDSRLNPRGSVAPGAYRRALEQREQMLKSGMKVAGGDRSWAPYGQGPLIVNDPRFNSVNGLGLVKNSGRVDSLSHDPASGRLFATIGTGGVWMSTDLAESWASIGDNLPSQAVGAVAWTPAGGGTVLVGGGEPLFLGGGSVFTGLGAFWSNDLGQTWNQAGGIPDGVMTFEVEVDPSRPEIVYIATSKGLFRSTDAGRSYANVVLPSTPDCAGVTTLGNACEFANVVTDVAVQAPGGSTDVSCDPAGCAVLAVIGYQLSNLRAYGDGTPLSPGNGLFRSATGEPGTFERLDSASGDGASNVGFPPLERLGRTEFATVTAADQDHNYIYAIVQDAVLLAGGARGIDIQIQRETQGIPNSSFISGLYASSDFGASWIRMADTAEIANNPNTGSFFVALQGLTAAGVQAWYNQWIVVDPTRQLAGVPTRLHFGLEEVWQNRLTDVPQNGIAQSGEDDYQVIGVYFAGGSCLGFSLDAPGCPGRTEPVVETTTHPDQHDAIYVPTDDGGVCLILGNDGGVYKQCVGPGEEFSLTGWGDGHNEGFYTLLPYNIAAAKDGTVWFGLQDNGSGKIEPDTRKQLETFGGDGFYVAVNAANGLIAYSETTDAAMRVTTNGGQSWTTITPPVTGAQFSNPFAMDPLDPNHLITAGPEVVETLLGPDTIASDANTGDPGSWIEVFNLGTVADDDTVPKTMTTLDVRGDAAYVGACGRCNSSSRLDRPFETHLATNVGGDEPPEKGTAKGWHFASLNGLPDRYITSIKIHHSDPGTVYVTLGGYGEPRYLPPGRYQDANTNIGSGNVFKSTDAGETFVDISAGLPQVHANSIALRGGQLLVGTDIGVFASDDDGANWAPLGNGLPVVPVSKVEPSPCDPDQIFIGTYGRSVWEYHFTGNRKSCAAPSLSNVVAPVQEVPTGVEEPATPPDCGVDTDSAFTLNFSYTPPGEDSPAPTGFRIDEATEFVEAFFDDADESLAGGSNSRWQGTSGWETRPNPTTGSPAYYAPSLIDQNETLQMIDAVVLPPGGATLTFDSTQSTEACCDFLHVEVSTDGGTSFVSVASFSGESFVGERQVDLSAFAGSSVKLLFRATADELVPGVGTYIENIRITAADFTPLTTAGEGASNVALAERPNGTRYFRIAGLFAGDVTGPFSNVQCVTIDNPNPFPDVPPGTGSDSDAGRFGGALAGSSLLLLMAAGLARRRARRRC